MKRAAAIALPLVVLAGCSSHSVPPAKTVTQTMTASPTTEAGSDTSSASATASASATSDQPSDSAYQEDNTSGAPLGFGKTFTSNTGRQISLSEPVPYVPSDTAATGEGNPAGTVFRKVTVTLKNNSDQPFDTSDLSLTATAGERPVESVVDDSIGDQPYSTLLPRRKISWSVAYPVQRGENLTVEVSTPAGTVAIWDGPVN